MYDFVDLFSGLSSIFIVCVYTIVGIKIALVHRKTKDRIYIYMGLTLALIAESWYPSSVSFVLGFFNGEQGLQVFPQLYFFLGVILLPLSIQFWLVAFTDLMVKENQKKILLVYGIIAIVFEILFISFLFLNSPLLIGELKEVMDSDYKIFIIIFQLFYLFTFLLTGIKFAIASQKSSKPETSLKGKFLIIAMISFGVGSLMDIASPLSVLILILARLFLVISAVAFYCGFILPKIVKKRILK